MRKEDFEISKLSYTNKDFASIYPEILDIAKQLTNKWDPSMSNESDPGVVLLKEGAFLTDHINYNIDKNILENFLPSATQDRSVRDIVEMNGYTPRYYVSATGEVRLRYRNEDATVDSVIGPGVVIPKFTIVLSTDDESISYTQATDLTLSGDSNKDLVGTAMFIQGTLQSLAINNSGIITLDNLDDNRRLYLPEAMVAQNGIYISSVDGDRQEWKRDNYILTKPSGSRIYKVDYDSYMGLPYIEFPTDIASLIGNGLNIRYISTLGEAGNVTANSLVKVISPTEYVDLNGQSWLTEFITSSNASSFTNGKDPETINQMYNSFMKTVGTFETLVTCLDYSNYIYNIEDEMNHNLVSNVYVTDRRTDYNKALNITTYDLNGAYQKNVSLKNATLNYIGTGTDLPDNASVGNLFFKLVNTTVGSYAGILYVYDVTGWKACDNINLNDFTNLTEAMTPFDLSIYALKMFSIADYNAYLPQRALENSFKPVDENTLDDIKAYLEESKNICHTYKDPNGNDIFTFKNYAPLKVNIIPYYKVTKAERNEILNNIYIALSQNFNPRNIEFGEELDRDQLKKVIIEADSRIKDISLDFDYYMKAMTNTGLEYNLNSNEVFVSSSILVDLIAKNVLAGRVCIFDFGDKFDFSYGDADGNIINNVTGISTELKINVNTDSEASQTSQFVWEDIRIFDVEQDQKYNYKYNLKLYNGVAGSSVELLPFAADGTNTGDTFVLQQIDKETNKVAHTYEYTSKSNVGYQISVDSGTLQPVTNNSFLQLQNCNLTIKKRTVYQSNSSGTINVDYTLKENEVVQLLHPNYYSTKTYGTYVSYNYSGDKIPANMEYTLVSPITFKYTKDGVTQTERFDVGTTILANFDIYDTETISDKVSKDGLWYGVLSSNQTISKRERMTTVLDNTNLMCYWIINSSNTGLNLLFDPGETEKILGDQDYFIYADEALNDIIVLGSGTKLVRDWDDNRDWQLGINNYTIEAITDEGTGANIPWRRLDFNNHKLSITEMTVYTLGEGDHINIYDWSLNDDGITVNSEGLFINNEWKSCSANIDLTISGKETKLTKIPNYYYIRSRLDINMSSEHPQTMYHSDGATEIVKIHTGSGIYEITSKEDETIKIQCNNPISVLGGDNVDISLYTLNGINLDVYTYSYNKIKPYSISAGGVKTEITNKVISIPTDKALDMHVFPFWFYNPTDTIYPETPEAWIIPIYVENEALEVCVGVSKVEEETTKNYITIEDFNAPELPSVGDRYGTSGPDAVKQLVLKGSKRYYLLLRCGVTSMDVLHTGEYYLKIWTHDSSFVDINPACIIVDKPVMVKGLNKDLSTAITNGFINNPILDRMKALISGSDHPDIKYDYLYEPDSSMAIDLDRYKYVNAITGEYDMLAFDNPLILFDDNNVAHDMSIAEVDIANSVIDIARDMRSYN